MPNDWLPVQWQSKARDELWGIYDYIVAEGFPDTALNYITGIEQRCERWGEFPLSGRSRNDIRQGLRMLPYRNVIIVYFIENGRTLVITNIFHANQDYEALLRDS